MTFVTDFDLSTLRTNLLKTLRSMSAAVNPEKKCLFNLPYELRLEVYTLVLVRDRRIQVSGTGQDCQQPPLTHVCRQLRHETLPVFYGQNCFEIQVPGGSPLSLEQKALYRRTGHDKTQRWAMEPGDWIYKPWLRHIGAANISQLRNVTVLLQSHTNSCNYFLTMDFSRPGKLHATLACDYFDVSHKMWRLIPPGEEHEHEGHLAPLSDMLTSLGWRNIWQMVNEGTPRLDFEALFRVIVECITERRRSLSKVQTSSEVQCWLDSPWVEQPVALVRNDACWVSCRN